MSDKLYRLKDEVKKYFTEHTSLHVTQTELDWNEEGISIEALIEVPQRVELRCTDNCGYITKESKQPFTEPERLLMEQALNLPEELKEALMSGKLYRIQDLHSLLGYLRFSNTTRLISEWNEWLKTRK